MKRYFLVQTNFDLSDDAYLKNDVSKNFTSLIKKDFFIQNNIKEKLI